MDNQYNHYFKEILEFTVGEVRANGYHWYKQAFESKLKEAEKSIGIDAVIMSQCWMIAGDIWDINKVPLHAIYCYREALHWNEKNADAMYELAKLYMNLAEYDKAISFAKQFKESQPDDCEFEELYYEALYLKESNEAAVFNSDNILWLCAEKMATGHFNEVLLELKNAKDVASLLVIAQCYGALGDTEAYLNSWKLIYNSKEEIELKWADWFYMPSQIMDSATIWEILIQINPRIKSSSVFEIYDLGYTDHQPNAPQMRELSCLYRIYSTKKSVGGLKTLLKSFPYWIEVKNELSYLKIIDEQLFKDDLF